jgi:hypothetical protein
MAIGLLLIELYPAGLRNVLRPLELPPPSSSWLAHAPKGPVLELPWTDFDEGAIYVYWSTVHWQPLVDGWGSFQPPGSGFGLGLIGQRWPSDYAARRFRAAGVRYVVVHLDRLPPLKRARVMSAAELPPGVTLAAAAGAARIYEIDPHGPRPSQEDAAASGPSP